MKNERLYAAIGAVDDELLTLCETEVKKPKTIWKKYGSLAACLALVFAVTAIFGNNAGWFSGKIYTVELDGGTLSFYKWTGARSAASYAYMEGVDASMRSLTEDEREMLYGEAFRDWDFYAEGVFALGDRWGIDTTLIHVTAGSGSDQGRVDGGTKIIMSQGSNSIVEFITTEQFRHTASVINGVHVSAGYFITRDNSRGEQNIIYMASYKIGENNVYVECGGNLERSEEISAEIAYIIDTLTLNSRLDLVNITY
jgi:hypothetical protein